MFLHSPPSKFEGGPSAYPSDEKVLPKWNPPSKLPKSSITTQAMNTSWQRCFRRTEFLSSFASVCVLATCTLSCIGTAAAGLVQDQFPLSVVQTDELVSQSFHGNHSHVDYFRLLQRDGDSLLIGARNFVYNISLYDLSEHTDRRIQWMSRTKDSDTCFSKGKSEAECHNYIRVLAKKDEGKFFVCGTNAFKPVCRDYFLQEDGKFKFEESAGVGKCPYSPHHNSTFVFADGNLYSGTVVDFQGMNSLIYREPLKTDHNDYRQLHTPDFVHSFEYGDYVFFFFRETAVEYMNCGKRVYSRIARVCKGDKGVPQQRVSTSWTSFLKSRLNCSLPGEFPFYFDEIKSVSDVVLGEYNGASDELIYAVFSTPPNSIPGSAVCAFSMRQVLKVFDGPFKEQKDLNSNWMPVPQREVPEPRPGSCVNDSQTLPQETINFVKDHPLMDHIVPLHLNQPVLAMASFEYRFTKIAVDPQVPLLTGSRVEVIFIATDVGIILKVFRPPWDAFLGIPDAVIVEEIHVFNTSVAINNLQIAKLANGDSKLIVITDIEVKAIPLQRCEKTLTCGECIALQDPYCAWAPKAGVCKAVSSDDSETAYQNVTSGRHNYCPYKNENLLLQNPSTQIYTTEPTPSPTPEVETCSPCVCTDQSTSNSTPQTPTSAKPSPTEGPAVESTSVEEHLGVSENEIEPHLRVIPHPEVNYIPVVSSIPQRGGRLRPVYSTHLNRLGKELPSASGLPPMDANEVPVAYAEGATGPVVGASMDGPLIYSAETLAIAVTTACVAALVVGFISGFLFSRKCRGDDYPHFSETPYLDSKLNKCENTADPNMYTANNSNLPLGKQINNLVVTNLKNTNNGKSNMNTAADKFVKPAKCAYI